MYESEMPEIMIKHPERKHLPCVILLDKSGSMAGEPINALNEALTDFKHQFKSDNVDDSIIDICIIAFSGFNDWGSDENKQDIEILQPFAPANEMIYTKPLIANGGTPLAQAVETGLKEIARIRKEYCRNDINYFRPWLVCLTDGESTEDEAYYNSVKEYLKEAVNGKHLIAFGIGTGDGCNYKALYDFFGEGHAFILEDYNFKGLVSLLNQREDETEHDKEKPILKPVVFDDDSEEDSDDKITDSEQANEVFADGSEAVDNDQPKMPTGVDEEGNPLLHPVTFADDSETGDEDEKPVLEKITFDD